MSRFKKNILRCAVILSVLGALVLLLLLLPDNTPNEPESTDQDEIQTVTLVSVPMSEVQSISYLSVDGQSFTLLVKDNGVIELEKPKDNFQTNPSWASYMVNFSIQQPSLELIAQQPDPSILASFGLDRPSLTWTIRLKDSTERVFLLGAKTATGSGYYAAPEDASFICVISSYTGGILLYEESALYDYEFAPIYAENPETGQSYTLGDMTAYLKLTKSDGQTLEFTGLTKEELEVMPPYTYKYEMHQPYKWNASEYYMKDLMLGPISTITPGNTVQGITLENPTLLEIKDSLGWEKSLLIGQKDPETGGRYIQYLNTSTVFLDTTGDYSFLDVEYIRLQSISIWIYNITDVEKVIINSESASYTLDVNSEDKALLDGKEVDLAEAKRTYAKLLNIMIDGQADTELPWGSPTYQFTIVLKNGQSHEMKLYPLNFRQYAIELDGQRLPLYTLITTVQPLFDALTDLKNGILE